jgi:hypothetical protein
VGPPANAAVLEEAPLRKKAAILEEGAAAITPAAGLRAGVLAFSGSLKTQAPERRHAGRLLWLAGALARKPAALAGVPDPK